MNRRFVLGRRKFTTWVVGTGGLALFGCSSDSDDTGGGAARTPAVLPVLTAAMLSTDRTIVPKLTKLTSTDPRSPMDPAERASLLADGYGDYNFGPGEAIIERTSDGSSVPTAGANRKVLTRFMHITDIHVTDDESPVRLAKFDGGYPLDGAARPHAAFMGRVLNAAVRTVNALNDSQPLDFLLLGGDSTDSAQRNEMTWMVGILSGAETIACDSGDANDPVSGSNNDPKDPFSPEGLNIPWVFTLGNHDAEIMGINPISESGVETATGGESKSGVRDWSQPGGPVISGEVPADADRRPLLRPEMLALVASDGDGHGLSSLATNKASYIFNVEGTPLRFVVYDTAFEEGGADGVVLRPDLDGFLKPALDEAKADGKLVVLVSHHGLGSLGDGSAGSAATEAITVPPTEVREFFLSYENIVLSITGHTHEHVVNWVAGTAGGFWEVQTSSLVEFPNQMRLVEIADEDNGHLSIQLVGVDFATDDDAVAEEGRRLAIMDHSSGWGGGSEGTAEDRNVKLYIPLPSS